jgi:hypothetical protein
MFTIQYEPDEAEIRANIRINGSTWRAGRTRLVQWGAAIVMLVAGVTLVLAGDGGIGVALVVVGALFTALLVSMARLIEAGIKLKTTPTTVTVTDDSITLTRARGTRVTRWTTVRSGTENHLGWSLMGRPPVGFLPRRVFTPEQQAELTALIARHVGTGLRSARPASASDASTAVAAGAMPTVDGPSD